MKPLIDVPDNEECSQPDEPSLLLSVMEECGLTWSDNQYSVITLRALAKEFGEKYESLQRKIERYSDSLIGDIEEINISNKLFDRLKRVGAIPNKTPKAIVIYPMGVAKIAYLSEGTMQHKIRDKLGKADHKLHKELSTKYSNVYFAKKYQKEMSYLINNIFHSHKVENEKYVDGYRIDFLIDNHIAIECDEAVHDYYDKDHEKRREETLANKNYTFYRYDVRNGNVLSFIGDIIDNERNTLNVGNMVNEQPEIILCKDCVYSHMTYGGECKYCDKWGEMYESGESLYLEGDFFCGFGERKTDD